MRCVAAPAGRGAHRPLSVPLAGRDRHACGGFLGGDGAANRERKGAGGGCLELQRQSTRALRSDPACGLAPASLFSLIRREAAAHEIPWCAEHGTGVVCYSPMQSGLLTDGFTAARLNALSPDDWRRRAPEFQQPNLERNLALRDALRPIAQRHGTKVSAVAVAWTLAWPGVTGAIVGARSPEQVDGWIRAATLELTKNDLEEIASAIARTGAGAGPTRPIAAGARAAH